MPRTALILTAALTLSGGVADAHRTSLHRKTGYRDQRMRQELISYCANEKRRCLNRFGPTLPRHPDVLEQCIIDYNQCVGE